MKIRTAIQKMNLANIAGALLLLLCAVWFIPFILPAGVGIWGINETTIMNTTVNITNAAPEVIGNATLATPIDLEAYGNTTVQCNATVFDWDNDTVVVNATLYIIGVTEPSDPDHGNNHYSVINCTRVTTQDLYMNYTCNFTVRYYAFNQTNWQCNVTVTDPDGASASNISNYATINPLVAMYAPGSLDYGDLMVGDISEALTANITNAGNRNLNLTVEGWGAVPGDGWAMNCSYGYISVDRERFLGHSDSYGNMIDLASTAKGVPDFEVPLQTNDTQLSINSTWWRLQIPPFAGGICTGKILFTASDADAP